MQLYNTRLVPFIEDELWDLPDDLPSFSGRQLLVITAPYAPGSKEDQTLQKMMTACKLGNEDYSVLSLEPGKRLAWAAFSAGDIPKRILLLGITPSQLAINALFRLNAPNDYLGHVFIPSLSLDQIDKAPELKKELWASGLKPVFGL